MLQGASAHALASIFSKAVGSDLSWLYRADPSYEFGDITPPIQNHTEKNTDSYMLIG